MSEETRVLTRDSEASDDAVLTERKQLSVLDLFSGTGSATRAFKERGHVVVTLEADEQFDADIQENILNMTPGHVAEYGPFDFIWASPPCTSFSVGSFRHHWKATTRCQNCFVRMERVSGERWEHVAGDCDRPKADRLTYTPKSHTASLGLSLLRRTLDIIWRVNPRWWIIENPRALMRKMPVLANVERRTITHCQYGDPRRMKPTDLFGVFPDGFEARACKNGAPCHEAAPRGAKTGTQGLDKTESAMLPPDLGLELCLAMEAALADSEHEGIPVPESSDD